MPARRISSFEFFETSSNQSTSFDHVLHAGKELRWRSNMSIALSAKSLYYSEKPFSPDA